ncbi:MAG: BamA/TamA family outer membrane protein [candidate division KSB1 bacterium]|nr:BamA/TamA family outer membrane protein [candidate division KSB1 bacterium]
MGDKGLSASGQDSCWLGRLLRGIIALAFPLALVAAEGRCEAGRAQELRLVRHGWPSSCAPAELPGVPDSARVAQWLEELVRRDLLRLANCGFLLARLDSGVATRTRGGFFAELYYSAGPRLRHGQVETRISDPSPELPSSQGQKLQETLPLSQLPRYLHQMQQSLLNSGHPYFLARIESVQLIADTVRLGLILEQGPLVKLRGVEFPGLRQTRPSTLARHFGLRAGAPFRLREVERGLQRLRRLPYVRRASAWQLSLDERGEGHLSVWVEEVNTNQFEGLLGYVPGENGDRGYAVGRLDFRFGNLFGTGRSVGVHWNRKDRLSQEMELSYTEPFLGRLPLELGGQLRQRVQDSLYVERALGLRLQLNWNDPWQLAAEAGREVVSPGRQRGAVPASRGWSVGAAILTDQRDDPRTPRSGFLYQTGVRLTDRSYPCCVRSTDRQISADLEVFVPLSRVHVEALQLHLRTRRSSRPSMSVAELFRLGGASSLRGYREDQFLGSDVLWVNLEHRYLLGDLSWVFAFLDLGHIGRRPAGPALWRAGYGLGIRLPPVGGVGQFELDLALGQGDGLSEAKLHLRLLTGF